MLEHTPDFEDGSASPTLNFLNNLTDVLFGFA